MKYTFNTMATPGMELEKIIAFANDYGFDGVDLRIGASGRGEIREDIKEDEAENILKIMGNKELTSILCYNEKMQQGKGKFVASVISCMEIANKFNCKNIRIFPGKPENERELNDLADALNEIFKESDLKINVLLQNHLNNGITCLQAAKLKEKVKDCRYGFIFSPEQAHMAGESYFNFIDDITGITKQIYIADIDNDNKYTLIGKGIIPFNEILEKMKNNGFDGLITLKWEKCWCDYLPQCEEAFVSFNNYFKR